MTVYSYGVMLAASYLLGLRLAMTRGKNRGLDSNRVLDLGIYIIIAALVGAKLLLLVVDRDQFRSLSDLFSLVRAGGVFYGGLLVAVAVAFWYMNKHRMPFWTTCDVFAPAIALGHVTGRLGCMAAGCCYGKPTDVPWAIVFTNPLAAANVGTPLNIPLHPTQLYEAGAELLILVLLLFPYCLYRFTTTFDAGPTRLNQVANGLTIAVLAATSRPPFITTEPVLSRRMRCRATEGWPRPAFHRRKVTITERVVHCTTTSRM